MLYIDANSWIPVHTGVGMRCPLYGLCLIAEESKQGVTILSYILFLFKKPHLQLSCRKSNFLFFKFRHLTRHIFLLLPIWCTWTPHWVPPSCCTEGWCRFFPFAPPSFLLTGNALTHSLSTPPQSPNCNCTHYDVTTALFCRKAKWKKAVSNY